MPTKTPTIQEIVDAFLITPIVQDDDSVIVPSKHLLFNKNDQSIYTYNSGVWKILPVDDFYTGPVARLLESFLRESYPELSITSSRLLDLHRALIRNIPRQYSQLYYTPYSYLQPDDEHPQGAIINVKTLEVVQPSPDLFCFHELPFSYEEMITTQTPYFERFLKSAFSQEDDYEKLQTLMYELIAYYLYPQSQEPATFFLYGAARTGKSTFLDLLTYIIGDHYTTAFSLQSLTTSQYYIVELAGKRVNILDEDESKFVRADKLKALVSNRPMEVSRKFQQPFTMTPTTKFIFSSNQLPQFQNIDEGVLRRLHFIEFKYPVPVNEQIKDLFNLLKREAPGIVRDALTHGQAFLGRNQEFTIPPSTLQTKELFKQESSPILRFIDEELTIDPENNIKTSNDTIYGHYTLWCERNGHKPANSVNFFRALSDNKDIISSRDKKNRYKNVSLRLSL
jgi:P4 family phage/plasmid primase-like protien